MCTVTFWPKKRGYLLGMNRDEQRTRPLGLPPVESEAEGLKVVHPSEPAGGTWISVNQLGTTIALINWYSIPGRAKGTAVSRGQVVLATRAAKSSEGVANRLASLPLAEMNPFRLIGMFEDERAAFEWRWDRETLSAQRQPWEPRQWISSGHDEPAAQRVRSAAFDMARLESDAGSTAWLRRLHSSHLPECGPFSTCMHRVDAATVSYTEVSSGEPGVSMHHTAAAPCQIRVCEASALFVERAPISPGSAPRRT